MPGSDQSQNLGGMLSQIGGTIGAMGDTYSNTFNNVMQAVTKPKGDPNDPNYLMQLAEWARQNGDPQAASMYMSQANMKQKEVQAKQKMAVDQAQARMVNEYAKVSRDPNATPEQKQKAYDTLMQFGDNAGRDVTQQIGSIDSQVRADEDQAWQEKQRVEAEAEKNAITAINAEVAKAGTDTDALLKVVERAPEQFKGQAQTIVNRTITFNDRQRKAESDARDLKSPVSSEPARASIAEISSEDVRARFESQLEELEKTAPKEGEQWANAAERHQYNQKMNRLAEQAFAAETDAILKGEQTAAAEEKDYQRARNRALTTKVTQADIDLYKDQVDLEGLDVWSEWGQDMTERVRQWRAEQVDIAYGRTEKSDDDLVNEYL